ncbi:AAA family ATPase [Ferrovibrio sp.]|uniref:ATP-dependent nuclease n=1 Tax=Ferrovibrio sp. TaxID=1917215 RepID=UPI000CBEFE55|nr:AAA family ATPase [Ferrovibrio sp.]PJI41843.1 MAG: ATP-dependent endonuclease [Ferrovibrio sp.]
MHIEKVRVEGFRLLENVEIMLQTESTVIVGRNNSGKTSLTDAFARFAGESGPKFRLEDFSSGVRRKFLIARDKRAAGEAIDIVLSALPEIALTLTFRYDPAEELGPLSPFVIDLDPETTTAIVKVAYAPSPSVLTALLEAPAVPAGADPSRHFFRHVRDQLVKCYALQVTAIDPTDLENTRSMDGAGALTTLLQCGFVSAQRTLDVSRGGDTDVIGKLLGTLFQTASTATAAAEDQAIVAALKGAVEGIEQQIQGNFDIQLKSLLPAFAAFGFPSLSDTELRPETSLNVDGLLSDHTKILYEAHDGVHLPEGYNGLGTRNLIYMLLNLEAFHKAYRARATRPGIHLVFIEEPEAHLHPQMQEVFINQLGEAVKKLSEKYPAEPAWQVQFVVSTHSSHVANAAEFDAIRYFLSTPHQPGNNRKTKVKDFRRGMDAIPPEDRNFLHQYMTLTKCDLYFADKAILIEGTTERLLMPRLCRIVDNELPAAAKLARQYVTTIEIGGSYADKFYPLLDFLELKSIVITDIDAVYRDETGPAPKWKKCPTATGTGTSNVGIRKWFDLADGMQVAPAELIAKNTADKTKNFRRLAYQIPEDGSDACARSFEDALILANQEHFGLGDGDKAVLAWEMAQDMPKADTALEFALRAEAWNVPKYIKEGLVWLSDPPPPPADPPDADGAPGPDAA